MKHYQSTNPKNQEPVFKVQVMSREQVQEKLNKAFEAYQRVLYTNDRKGLLKERLEKLKNLRDLIKERIEKCAEMITNEMGKPIKEARAEIDKGIKLIEYYFDNTEKYLSDEQIDSKF